MEYYAHSPKDGVPAQPYAEHIQNVIILAKEYASAAAHYGKRDGGVLMEVVEATAYWHDLGKLDDKNQEVLSGRQNAPALPRKHWDVGAAILKSENLFTSISVYSHHSGYPNFSEENAREEQAFRVKDEIENTDRFLNEYIGIHKGLLGVFERDIRDAVPEGDRSVFFRILLSCVADADHTDTARHYGKYPKKESKIELRPQERLAALNRYVAELSAKNEHFDERSALRDEMYAACRDAKESSPIVSNDGPVGSGKTTALMANLLTQAIQCGLRRIFVVLPFTNIIEQSVDVYRKALVLPGEDPKDVVAELHHRADFESEDARHLTALWRAPIIVTTAVAFFETLASKTPATLRRLHELPGSAIFVDESHAALPAKLLPIAWRWIRIFAEEWGCHWALASGSLCRFWQIPEIAQVQDNAYVNVPDIVDEDLRLRLTNYERGRIDYRANFIPQTVDSMLSWIKTLPGPRLVVLNTVKNAAVLADAFSKRFGRGSVEHLSNALKPSDREKMLNRVKERLKDKSDIDWVLFASSCVEAGVNLSFRTGLRELCSFASLIQTSGRVNRDGEYDIAEMWTFTLASGTEFNSNPGVKEAAEVLRGYFTRNIDISPDLCTAAIAEELKLQGISGVYKNLIDDEDSLDFLTVEDNFKVIDNDTHIVVVDADVAKRIRDGKIDWRELQKNSVQINNHILKKFGIQSILDDIYYWNLGYDDFLGYMSGLLQYNNPDEYII